jgi:trehalose-6-phosphate synthase
VLLLLLQVMLGVDRLDMIKGIPQKLLAFEKFLHEHPEWRDKVLLVQVRSAATWHHATLHLSASHHIT